MPTQSSSAPGQNGLVAANVLADAGWSVVVFEAAGGAGGAVRSGGARRARVRQRRLQRLLPARRLLPGDARRWSSSAGACAGGTGPLVLAHPTPDGRCVALSRDIDETGGVARRVRPGDGDAWRELMRLWARIEPALLRGLATPVPPVRSGADLLLRARAARARDLARMALCRSAALRKSVSAGEGAALLLGGNALHADLTPESALGGFFGSSSPRSVSATGSRSPRAAPARSPGARRARRGGRRDDRARRRGRARARRARTRVGVGRRRGRARASRARGVSVWELDRLLVIASASRRRAGPGGRQGRLDARRPRARGRRRLRAARRSCISPSRSTR